MNSLAQPFNKNANRDTYKTYQGQIYSNINVLPCGNAKVAITSICVANDTGNSDPYCFSQTAAFVQIQKRQASSVLYAYEEDKQQFIYSAACMNDQDKLYVELNSSNLGNCTDCEWSDYFNIDGSYIGSSDSPPRKTSFQKIRLTKRFHEIAIRATRTKKINLTTIAH